MNGLQESIGTDAGGLWAHHPNIEVESDSFVCVGAASNFQYLWLETGDSNEGAPIMLRVERAEAEQMLAQLTAGMRACGWRA